MDTKNTVLWPLLVVGDGGKISHPTSLMLPSEILPLATTADALRNRPNVSGVGLEIKIHAGSRDGLSLAASPDEDELPSDSEFIGSNKCLSTINDVVVMVRYWYFDGRLSLDDGDNAIVACVEVVEPV